MRAGYIVLCLAVLFGCAERERILPGEREPLRPVPQAPEVSATPFAAPAQRANETAAQFEGSPAYRTVHPALGSNPALVWSARIGDGDARKLRITADPVVDAQAVYTLDAGSTVSAVSRDSGAVLWQQDIRPQRDAAGDATGGGLALADGRLFVSSGFGVLVALDAASGAILWDQQLDATGAGRPMVAGGLVYLTAGDQTGWAVEADTGRIAWQIGATETIANVLGAPSPVLVGDLVVFAFGSGELQAVFRQGGLRRWDSSVLGERPGRALSKIDDVTGVPFASDGVLYAGNQAGRTVALDPGSGARIWTAQEGAVDAVLPVGGSVFLVSDGNALVRLDAATGATLWSVPLPNFTARRPRRASEVFAHHGPILAGGVIWIASGDGLLRGFEPQDGSLIRSVPIPGGATTRPVVAGGTLYVVSRAGQLLAYR